MDSPIWITGSKGQLGIELQRQTDRLNNIFATDAELDICDSKAVRDFIAQNHIRTIINCAAFTNAEAAEDNPSLCRRVNAYGPANLAQAALEADAALIHISTDYVFDGKKRTPYTEKDTAAPLSVYGLTKEEGERSIREIGCRGVIIRTAWLFSPYGVNFMKTMINLGRERAEIGVVCDQIGSPTAADSLASAILIISRNIGDRRGEFFHYSSEGPCSWSDFASAILLRAGSRSHVNEIKSNEYPQKAVRPAYSYLDKSLIKQEFGIIVESWQSALERNMRRYEKSGE